MTRPTPSATAVEAVELPEGWQPGDPLPPGWHYGEGWGPVPDGPDLAPEMPADPGGDLVARVLAEAAGERLQRDEGAALLDELYGALTRFVIFPSGQAAIAATLWTAASHAQPAWEHATRLVVKSPLKRCGKSRLLDLLEALCHNALVTVNVSVAALVRSIDEDDPPTLLLDEADTVFGRRRGERAEAAEDLRGILNAGHQRGRPYLRWDVAARQAERCPTSAMAALAAIGDLPDIVEDRGWCSPCAAAPRASRSARCAAAATFPACTSYATGCTLGSAPTSPSWRRRHRTCR